MPRKTAAPPAPAAPAAPASMRPRPDAAENSGLEDRRGRAAPGFNEAAARCRGKRWPEERIGSWSACFNEAAARCRGKQPRATATRRPPRCSFNEAAARCRGKRPGDHEHRPAAPVQASMRPRPDAAENILQARRREERGVPGFNEAAARCRGKPESIRIPSSAARSASMRPRPDAAENCRVKARRPVRLTCFNEAAARCRGKRTRPSRRRSSASPRFNEAAARCRGKRPRGAGSPSGATGFNEAAARCRGKHLRQPLRTGGGRPLQ